MIYAVRVPAARVPRLSRTSDVKPRILIVDDHRGVLDRVSALLSDDFIVSVAAGGRQALDTVPQLDPDAIVLDINMPDIDGFQTMRALERMRSRAPVVFLSMIDAAEEMREAFRCGGRGFVVKTRMLDDLANAIDQVLAGRSFAPTLTALLDHAGRAGHATQLYGEAGPCLDDLDALFDLALRRGDATCLIAPPEVREGLADRLQCRGWKVAGPEGPPHYLAVDTETALGRIMRDGLPDTAVLAEIVAELDAFRRNGCGDVPGRLTIWGNMASCLIHNGNVEGALAMEAGWDFATQGFPFFTVCGYSVSCFRNVPELWSGACAAHSAVSHAGNLRIAAGSSS